jgi:trans-2,3-dihydro-3-hydroxyanthranilate isomerase
MRSCEYFLIDVFTGQAIGGNPLAVFPDADDFSQEEMQEIATALNLSETTFLQKSQNPGSDCTVRIFTPRCEVPMAGHPTIGTAFFILSQDLLAPKCTGRLVFDLGVGPIVVEYEIADGEPEGLMMHQPLPEFGAELEREGFAEALSLGPDDLDERFPVQLLSCGVPFIIVPLKSLKAVQKAFFKLEVLDKIHPALESKEVMVFSMECEEVGSTAHSRMFAPRFGIIEDPATGAAQGPLASYLVR